MGSNLHSASEPARSGIALRALAVLEGAKGVLACVLAVGALRLVHHDLVLDAIRLNQALHLGSGNHFARLCLEVASRITDRTLGVFVGALLLYSAVRLAEAYGLWFARPWAEWFGAASGAVYIPFELQRLLREPGLLNLGLLALNVVIVAYLLSLRLKPAPSAPAALDASEP